mgnify:CR=1 FL=1
MNFHVMTLFPEMIVNGLSASVIGRALDNGTIGLNAVNIRDYAYNKHNKVDDYTYGGGAGMLMQAEPVYLCYEAIRDSISRRRDDAGQVRVIYMTPQGSVFDEEKARELSREEDLIILCGHYEGIDERVIEEIVTDNLSIGDYVLTGGELPALVMMDAISRMIPGVLGSDESAGNDSFQDGLLEHPHYTRPEEYHGMKVPEVLLSGHHRNIEIWRRRESIKRTYERRPELLLKKEVRDTLSKEDLRYLQELEANLKL